MNFLLADLLPGARQARNPLAIGYLWLLVAWINAPRIPAKIRKGDLPARAVKDISHLSPLLIILIVSCAAYVVGLFFEMLDEIALALATTLLITGALLAAVIWITTGLHSIGFAWPLVVIILVIGGGLAYYRSTQYKTPVSKEILQWVINIYVAARDLVYTIRTISGANAVRKDLIADAMARLLKEDPELIPRFCETVSALGLRAACSEAGLRQSRMKHPVTRPDGTIVDLGTAAARSFIDPECDRLLRDFLRERLQANHELRRSVGLRVMKIANLRSSVDRALAEAAAKIQADKPTVFDTWDRIRSEGEFRRGIAAPIGAALASVCAIYTANIPLIVAAAVPALFLYGSGIGKRREADGMMASLIDAGIAPVRLKVTDSLLLEWPVRSAYVRTSMDDLIDAASTDSPQATGQAVPEDPPDEEGPGGKAEDE
jgi:hypothetical protein